MSYPSIHAIVDILLGGAPHLREVRHLSRSRDTKSTIPKTLEDLVLESWFDDVEVCHIAVETPLHDNLAHPWPAVHIACE